MERSKWDKIGYIILKIMLFLIALLILSGIYRLVEVIVATENEKKCFISEILADTTASAIKVSNDPPTWVLIQDSTSSIVVIRRQNDGQMWIGRIYPDVHLEPVELDNPSPLLDRLR